jgi:hypothetical protein
MLTLPPGFQRTISDFSAAFRKDVWPKAQLLLTGAIICPGSRTVCIYRDPVRFSKSHFVKCSGLRWLSVMLITGLPWLEVGVFWALPILTALCPSERFYHSRGKAPKKLTDWACQIITWLSRKAGQMKRPIYLTGDGSFIIYTRSKPDNRPDRSHETQRSLVPLASPKLAQK